MTDNYVLHIQGPTVKHVILYVNCVFAIFQASRYVLDISSENQDPSGAFFYHNVVSTKPNSNYENMDMSSPIDSMKVEWASLVLHECKTFDETPNVLVFPSNTVYDAKNG